LVTNYIDNIALFLVRFVPHILQEVLCRKE